MSLHDSDNWLIEASTATESLPDPNTVLGRTHFLHNNFAGAQTWTAPGATPFNINGVPAANLVIPQGESRQVYAHSAGPDWHVVIPTDGPAANKSFRVTGTTNASGDVTFNLTPAGFAATPVVDLAYQGAAGDPVDYRITALTATSCTVHVIKSPLTAIALLGISLLGAPVPVSGATVHLIAVAPGFTV